MGNNNIQVTVSLFQCLYKKFSYYSKIFLHFTTGGKNQNVLD